MPISARPPLASAAVGGFVAVTALGALLSAPLAHAAPGPDPATCPGALGVAARYAEFIEDGGGRPTPAAEGEPGPGAAAAEEPSLSAPPDFAAEFRTLRKTSDDLGAVGGSASAQWRLGGSDLRLTGTDPRFNSFAVPAAELEKAKEIRLRVPDGAVTVVNVAGTSYDQTKAGATGFFLGDEAGGREVLDDEVNSAAGGRIRAKLLWNFPDATKVVKHGANAWPGTVLAPDADFGFGPGSGGPVNGSVIARSLTAGGGRAQTHHHPFTGCLPGPAAPAVVLSATPAVTTLPGTPSGGPSGGPSPSPSAAAVSAPVSAPAPAPTNPKPGKPGTSATPAPSGSAPAVLIGGGSGVGGPVGGLALTGAGRAAPLAIGGACVLAAGVAMVLVARRRRA